MPSRLSYRSYRHSVVKPEKYFLALVHAESSLCGGLRVKSDVSGLGQQDHMYALLAGIWRSCKCHLCRSRRISCCSLGNPSNKCDTVAAEGVGVGGHPSPQRAGLMPAPMGAGLKNSQPVRWIEARLRAVSSALRGHRIEVRDYLAQRRSQSDRTHAVVDWTRAIAQQ
jgi:hypothetical protein